eukprot:gene25395-biopygen19491
MTLLTVVPGGVPQREALPGGKGMARSSSGPSRSPRLFTPTHTASGGNSARSTQALDVNRCFFLWVLVRPAYLRGPLAPLVPFPMISNWHMFPGILWECNGALLAPAARSRTTGGQPVLRRPVKYSGVHYEGAKQCVPGSGVHVRSACSCQPDAKNELKWARDSRWKARLLPAPTCIIRAPGVHTPTTGETSRSGRTIFPGDSHRSVKTLQKRPPPRHPPARGLPTDAPKAPAARAAARPLNALP